MLGKKQKNPIPSYGIILYCIRKNKPMYLLYQRRDTFEYLDFIRGLWNDEKCVIEMLNYMTPEEKNILLAYDFKTIWNDAWLDNDNHLNYHQGQYKYNMIRNRLPELVKSSKNYQHSTQWGWPKGKLSKKEREDGYACALREFFEETGISTKLFKRRKFGPFDEMFVGTDGNVYSTIYYVCHTPRLHRIKYTQNDNLIRKKYVSIESKDVGWFSYEQAREKLNSQRQKILDTIQNILENEQKNYSN